MPSFTYNALDRSGQSSAGTIEAPTRPTAINQLADQGLYVTTLTEGRAAPRAEKTAATASSNGRNGAQPQSAPGDATSATASATPASSSQASRSWPAWTQWLTTGRISRRARAAMWDQLATALEAGLPLLTALRVVQDQAEKPALANLAGDLAERVRGGESLAEALGAHPRLFSPMHLSMVRAGETAGVLDQVMRSLADFAERDLAIIERIRSAATYPAIVLTLALVSVAVILTFILPRILGAIAEDAPTLPLPTQILMVVSDALRHWGWLILLMGIVAGFGVRHWLRQPQGRLAFDQFKLRLPILGTTLRKAAVARFARGLGTLTGCGIPILEALDVLRDTLGNASLSQTIDRVRSDISQGESIAEPLRETGQFPAMFIQVVALGEHTGKLDKLLLRAADALEKDATASIERTMTVLPAMFIIVLALVVCFILAAVLLPIVNIQTSMPGM